MKDDEWIMWAAVLVIGLTLLLVVSAVLGVIWFLVSSIIAYHRYQRLLQEGGEVFDQIELEEGVDLPVDDVLRAMFGAGVELPRDGFNEPVDWLNATVIGMENTP